MASGTRAYSVGFEDGRFYANGWHITGEMGGLWTPPLKLLDGVWFGIDGNWIGQATKFTSGQGYTRFDLPTTGGLQLQRTDFVPDGRRGALYGLKMTNPGTAAKSFTVKVDAHSELMGAYPWGFDGVTPTASDNLTDTASYDASRGALQFTDQGALRPGLPAHDYSALVASTVTPDGHDTGDSFRGPQDTDGEIVCPGNLTDPMPSQCKDGPFGRGKGGELQYQMTIPAGGTQWLWVGAAGSDQSLADSQSELARLLSDPSGELAAKIASRQDLAGRTQVDLPGDRLLQDAVDWGKQNLADLTQRADNLQIRWTNQGKQFPDPLGTVPHVQFFGAGFPDYPWPFATDGEYTNFAAVALGQFQTAEDHLRALRDVSDILNCSGAAARVGDRRLDLVRARLQDERDERLQHGRDGQVPERRGADLALDRRQRVPRRDVRLREAQPALRAVQAGRRRRPLARGFGQRGADRDGPGEARQRRLLHPGAVRPRRHGQVQARRRDVLLGDGPRA